VILTYRPFRHEPLSVLSFTVGWVTGEAAIQNIVWQVGALWSSACFGAFKGWAGWLGLGIAIGSWAGLVGLAISGRRAARVVTPRSPRFAARLPRIHRAGLLPPGGVFGG